MAGIIGWLSALGTTGKAVVVASVVITGGAGAAAATATTNLPADPTSTTTATGTATSEPAD